MIRQLHAGTTIITVRELLKALKDVPKDTPIYTAAHDQPTTGTDGSVFQVIFINQRDEGEIEECYKLHGDYVVLRP